MPAKENGVLLPLSAGHRSVETHSGVNTRGAIWGLLPLSAGHRSVETHSGVNTRSAIWGGMIFFQVIIYSSYSILINLAKVRGHIPFSSSAVVLLIEVSKLMFSFTMYLPELFTRNYVIPSISVIMYLQFSIPAFLYAINNNIAIHMQVHMDPTTYQVLCNMKIATTALLYRIIMKRELTSRKWVALGLLVLAGVSDSYSGFHHKIVSGGHQIYITLPGLLMMLLYCTISGFAAVYSEYIMKKQLKMSIHVQNMMFYSYGILLNGGTWLVQHSQNDTPGAGFLTGFSTYTWLLVFTQAANGLIMSVLMKFGSNITRLFLIATAMLTSTAMSVIILGTQLNLLFISGALLVVFAFYLYYYSDEELVITRNDNK